MTKLTKHITLDKLDEENIWSDEWEDYDWDLEQNDWTNWDEHPWAWYMERDVRLREGWHHIIINPSHKDVTVIYWLKSQNAKFKHSRNEFLIQDSQVAMMVALKWT